MSAEISAAERFRRAHRHRRTSVKWPWRPRSRWRTDRRRQPAGGLVDATAGLQVEHIAGTDVGAQRHLAIDLLTMTLSPRRQALFSVIINLLILLFAGAVIVTGGVKLIAKTLSTAQVSAAMQIPMGYVYLILPLTGFMMMFYALCFISNGLKNIKHAE